ncbi:uncharacterized protein LOC142568171 [Dermacentor variabilis]|uniref:uncharacterized protein LOC142568171 n=1 Tax=Dermacentor variabilis TaxID=34621 RepID=UPI003F5B1712
MNQACNWADLTIVINTDGSPLYKSSNSSIWPIQFIVNELPPRERLQHVGLGGLWYGTRHPDMLLFLDKFVDMVRRIGTLTWEHASGTVTSAVHVICCSVDSPARALVCNQLQFNGHFGCQWCLACGQHEQGAFRYVDTEPAQERVSLGVLKDMKRAMELQIPVNGLKGLSPLVNLPEFDLVHGQAVEYMHCILLGVTRRIADLWFDPSNSQEAFYLGSPSLVAKVDARLTTICPPDLITRLPRSLRERAFWKAAEWRNWLLYYSLPCCLGVLHSRYWSHFALLVEAIFTLLTEELSPGDLTHAYPNCRRVSSTKLYQSSQGPRNLLQRFVGRTAGLYGVKSLTFNVHLLQHITSSVKNLGPLWSHSAFVFEGGNGTLLKHVTAAKGVPSQIIERIAMSQQLTEHLFIHPPSPNILELCQDMLGYKKIIKSRVIDGARIFGNPRLSVLLSNAENLALNAFCPGWKDVVEYFRFAHLGTVFWSSQYSKGKKKDCSVFESKDGKTYIIDRIFEISGFHGTPSLLLLCKKLVATDSSVSFPCHIIECFISLETPITVVPLSDIVKPSVFIDFRDEQKQYVCAVPNLVERD